MHRISHRNLRYFGYDARSLRTKHTKKPGFVERVSEARTKEYNSKLPKGSPEYFCVLHPTKGWRVNRLVVVQ